MSAVAGIPGVSRECIGCAKPLSWLTLKKARLGIGNTTGTCVQCWHEARRVRHALRSAKSCTFCKVEKPLDAYGKNPATIDGRRSRCRQCEAECAAQARKDNPAAFRAAQRRYGQNNRPKIREKMRHWRLHSKDGARKAVERATAWAKANPGRAKANKAAHRAAKLRAVPQWANPAEMKAIYRTATALGPDFHVDHVIPLQGKTVCGLHCEGNLQIIPASVNISKHNRRWPDMWEVAG